MKREAPEISIDVGATHTRPNPETKEVHGEPKVEALDNILSGIGDYLFDLFLDVYLEMASLIMKVLTPVRPIKNISSSHHLEHPLAQALLPVQHWRELELETMTLESLS